MLDFYRQHIIHESEARLKAVRDFGPTNRGGKRVVRVVGARPSARSVGQR